MILETIGTLISAVTLVLARIDRKTDTKEKLPDIKAGLVQLDQVLEDWIAAAAETNRVAAHYVKIVHSEERRQAALYSQMTLAADALKYFERQPAGYSSPGGPTQAQSEFPGVKGSTSALRRLLQIYAPEVVDDLARLARSRYDLTVQMLDDLAWSHQANVPIVGNPWEDDLDATLSQLHGAQRRLRTFIRGTFPIGQAE